MESRFQRILLILLTGSVLASATQVVAAENAVVNPQIERRQVFDDGLDTENFEVGFQVGMISIEDFESDLWLTGHVAYHVTDMFYLKAQYGQAEAGKTSFEKLSNTAPLLTDDQREYKYYGLNVGYNFMPGEVFLTKDLAFNSVFSIELGGGTTEFADDDNFTVNLAANYRIFINDWLAWDIGMTDYIFDTEITGESKTTHNFTFATGVVAYF